MSEAKSDFMDSERSATAAESASIQAGFVKFYGVYWKKSEVNWQFGELLGRPWGGWTGSGQTSSMKERDLQLNFWKQKGVYILYDGSLTPVYAGQAGLVRKGGKEGGCIGDRLRAHAGGKYKNGWTLFSWFGLQSLEKFSLRGASPQQKDNPAFYFERASSGEDELKNLLASFEAILIEGFSPRFNARGGDLKGASFVSQYEADKT